MPVDRSTDQQPGDPEGQDGNPQDSRTRLTGTTEFGRRTFVSTAALAGGVVAAGGITAAPAAGAERAGAAGTATDLALTVNGELRRLRVDNRTSLLDLLRERLGLPGTKKGCDQGACGACTVLVDDLRVNACLTLAVQCESAKVTTIEGVADGEQLHPLQKAFVERDAFQCGYCTPGQIMSGIGCIREGHTGTPEEIREWMSGNICRCGCYVNIVAAVQDAAHGK
ncbi:(2Fe-2S)-binding protein [Streptomyces sp. NPDC088387]|uniref:(2Fe-2S)-binding protein n=1 Tax=Streptomyces sp. NPDC088387 TaxID=3365859 RepID=UPI00381B0339